MSLARAAWLLLPLLVITVALGCSRPDNSPEPTSDTLGDTGARDALVALYDAYRAAWLRNDTSTESAVLSLFEDDATIVPAGGRTVHQGHDELRRFWFPPGPGGVVDRFDIEVLLVDTDSAGGSLLGRFTMQFTDETGRYATAGFHQLTAAKNGDHWKIATLMWTHPPWEMIESE